MNQRKIFSNALISVIQVIVLSGTLLFLYRYLLDTIGAEKIGVWSLVLASVSFSKVANLGLSGGIVKFVAKYIAVDDQDSVSRVIQTTLISTALFFSAALIVIYPVAKYLLHIVLDKESLESAIEILPIALVSVLLISISGIITGALDGFQRFDIRASIIIISSLLYVACCVYLVEDLGLVGLAYAQMLQYISVLVLGFYSLRKLAAVPYVPHVFDKAKFHEIFRYGINFQLISLTTLFLEPTTKGLLSVFGGVHIVGYYEMASKLVLQLRSLVVTANQVVVPVVAHLAEITPGKIQTLYITSTNIIILVATPLFILLGVMLYLISRIWLGFIEESFIVSGYILVISWLANTLVAPAYFFYLGAGQLRINVISHIVTALLNFLLGWLFGNSIGWIGVVLGWATASMLGSFIIIAGYHYQNNIGYRLVMTPYNAALMASGVVALITAYLMNVYNLFNLSFITNQVLMLAIFLLVSTYPIILNPTSSLLKTLILRRVKA